MNPTKTTGTLDGFLAIQTRLSQRDGPRERSWNQVPYFPCLPTFTHDYAVLFYCDANHAFLQHGFCRKIQIKRNGFNLDITDLS